ncbi:MAG: hypothetical protein JWO19_1226 [Bryobacterales bacterium]|nr:hypothetical protein [Bryobacterales bacterium]
MNPSATRMLVRGLALLLALTLFSLLPEPLKGRLATAGLLHECTHIAAFGITFVGIAIRVKSLAASAALAVLLIGFGAALELLQTAVYGNYLEYWDIRADAAGVALGMACQRIALAISSKSRPASLC